MMQNTYLLSALELAKIRRGFCAPNPSVGAVIVKNEKIIATGFHFASGHPHAEVDALNKVNDEAKGASLYVTLEPCCHWGKTPPCTELIIQRGIKEVIYAYQDPNLEVNGRGCEQLINAGINCYHEPLPAIDDFYASYYLWRKTGMPYVTAKLAITLDGKIADKNGHPAAITGEALRQFTHQHRKHTDAILTTSRTIHRDNPQLNVRLENEHDSKSIYVLDSDLSISPSANIFKTAKTVTLLHKNTLPAGSIPYAHYMGVSFNEKGLDILEVLKIIGQEGVHDVWVEAGGQCFTQMLSLGLVQKAFVYVAPKILGQHAVSGFITDIDIFAGAKNIHWQIIENNAVCTLEFK